MHLIEGLGEIEEELKLASVDSSITSEYIVESIRAISKSLVDMEKNVSNYNSDGYSGFSDSFSDTSLMGSPNLEENADVSLANIIQSSGVLTLPIKKVLATNSFTVSIESTNGLSGNSHVISTGASNNVFVGESGLNADLNNILNTSKLNWYECEMFNLEDEVFNACNGLGFEYKEGVSWVNEDDHLYLNIRLKATSRFVGNWFSISPYVVESQDYYPATLESVTINDGVNTIQRISSNKTFNKNIIITFNEQEINYIDIVIKCYRPYNVPVGHIYSSKMTNNIESVFNLPSSIPTNRVDVYKPSIAALMMSYDPKTKKVTNLKNSSDLNSTKSLFEPPTTTSTNVKSGIEVIRASRYAIGIRSVEVGSYSFKTSGIYISKPFKSNKEITSVTLNADDSLPNSKASIKYSISFDSGENWISLTPRGRINNTPCTVKINSDIPFGMRNSNTVYIDRLVSTTSVVVKIELDAGVTPSPDEEAKNATSLSTPMVHSYTLDIKTIGGENFVN